MRCVIMALVIALLGGVAAEAQWVAFNDMFDTGAGNNANATSINYRSSGELKNIDDGAGLGDLFFALFARDAILRAPFAASVPVHDRGIVPGPEVAVTLLAREAYVVCAVFTYPFGVSVESAASVPAADVDRSRGVSVVTLFAGFTAEPVRLVTAGTPHLLRDEVTLTLVHFTITLRARSSRPR